jgi:hypothetical protein
MFKNIRSKIVITPWLVWLGSMGIILLGGLMPASSSFGKA